MDARLCAPEPGIGIERRERVDGEWLSVQETFAGVLVGSEVFVK